MNIYKVSRRGDIKVRYDEYDSFIVICANREEALAAHPYYEWDYEHCDRKDIRGLDRSLSHDWVSYNNDWPIENIDELCCELIGTPTPTWPKGVIATSFHAG